jgi:hypothetical protein
MGVLNTSPTKPFDTQDTTRVRHEKIGTSVTWHPGSPNNAIKAFGTSIKSSVHYGASSLFPEGDSFWSSGRLYRISSSSFGRSHQSSAAENSCSSTSSPLLYSRSSQWFRFGLFRGDRSDTAAHRNFRYSSQLLNEVSGSATYFL